MLTFTESKYFYESKAPFHLFDREILVYVDKASKNIDFEYAQKCVDALNGMADKTLAELCKYSVLYCNTFCEEVGEEAPAIEAHRDILKYVRPTLLMVDEQKDQDIVIHLECNCDWEPEHGLEWLIKGDTVLYVGANMGISPYSDEKHFQKPWNYVYVAHNY